MKRTLVCMAAIALAFAARADSVPQDSARKYYFTKPLNPEGIKGKVRGENPDYDVMRSEDVAWIQEALAEREALRTGRMQSERTLAPEFGKWQMSATNGCVTWTTAVFAKDGGGTETNVVAKYMYKTNGVPGMAKKGSFMEIGEVAEGSLQPWWGHYNAESYKTACRSGSEAVLLQGPSVLGGWWLKAESNAWETAQTLVATNGTEIVFPMVTNVVETTWTNWTGRYVQDGNWHESIKTNFTYITMATTNGLSVHTNMWTEIVPRVENETKTNVYAKSQLGMMFTSGMVELYDPEMPSTNFTYSPFRESEQRKWYGALKGTKVLASNATNTMTNRLRSVSKEYSRQRSTSEGETTEDEPIEDEETEEVDVVTIPGIGAEANHSVYRYKSEIKEWHSPDTDPNYDDEDYPDGKWVVTGVKEVTDESEDTNIGDYENSEMNLKLRTWLNADIAGTGGVKRVEGADVYVWATANWERRWEVWDYEEIEGERDEQVDKYRMVTREGMTNSFAVVMKRFEAQEDTAETAVTGSDTNKYICFSVSVPVFNMMKEALGALGKSMPSELTKPDLEEECREPYLERREIEEERDGETVKWETVETHSTTSEAKESYGARIDRIVVVIRIRPWTSLSGW